MFQQPLLADIWGWIVPVVIIIIYALNHLLSGGKAQQAQKQRQQQAKRRAAQGERALQQPAQPQQPPPQALPRPQQAGGQDSLHDEIEQFLRRANERRKEKAQRSTLPERVTPLEPAPPARAEQPVDVQPVEHSFDAVATSVAQHFNSSRSFEQRAEHMADQVEKADDDMQRHLKQAFDHRLGTLRTTGQPDSAAVATDQPAAPAQPPTVALGMAGVLNPQNLKQAILLKEILERPVDRW
jgi:hypothetical protein